MQSLTEFYYQLADQIAPLDRFNTITVIDDVVVINFDCIYDRECAIRGTDQLLYQAHKLGTGKRFLFLSEDGANLAQSGAVAVITNIINCFGLNHDTCAVVCREYLNIPNVAVIVKESIDYWCRVLYPTIKDIPISPGPFAKKFAVWFHRGTFYRLDLARHLFENHFDSSYISYQESGVITDRKMAEYFTDDIAWAKNHTPIIYDQLFPDRVYDFDMIVGAGRKPYLEYFMEIVAETDILSTNWITEKTIKNLYIGKPFIVMGGAGTLERLRSRGFKTFSPWVNETYDTIANIHGRLTAIKQEIDRLATVDLNQLYKELLPTLEYNREVYGEHINSW